MNKVWNCLKCLKLHKNGVPSQLTSTCVDVPGIKQKATTVPPRDHYSCDGRSLRAILNFTPHPQEGNLSPREMFTPSFTPRGEHSPLFRGIEGRTENFTPGDNFTPMGEVKNGPEHSLLFRGMEGWTENFTPGDNFTPRGQNSPLGSSLTLGAKLRMGLWTSDNNKKVVNLTWRKPTTICWHPCHCPPPTPQRWGSWWTSAVDDDACDCGRTFKEITNRPLARIARFFLAQHTNMGKYLTTIYVPNDLKYTKWP
jgi:hypothetical protein